jgi:hypothetical protein
METDPSIAEPNIYRSNQGVPSKRDDLRRPLEASGAFTQVPSTRELSPITRPTSRSGPSVDIR